MANIIQKVRKKYRRKRLLAQKARMDGAQRGGNSSRQGSREARLLRRKRKARNRLILIGGLAAVLVLLLALFFERRTYKDYKILQISEQEDVISTKYVEMGGRILRYNPGSVSLVNKHLESIWSVS